MENIVVIGTGGLGRETAWLIDEINYVHKKFNLLGFVDDNKINTTINGYTVLGDINWLLDKKISVAIGIADPLIKNKIVKKLKRTNVSFPNLIHPDVIKSKDVKLGEGNIIFPSSVLTLNIEISNFVLISYGVTIGHDVTLKDNVSILPGANISGNILLEKNVTVGANSVIIQGLTVGENAFIGAGSVVTKNVQAQNVVVGNPANILKKDK